MKKSKRLAVVLSALLLCCFMATGCTKEEVTTSLNGAYTAGTSAGATTYTFGEENTVAYEYSVGGQTLYSVNGTYEINEDGDVLTMEFPKESIADVPVGIDVDGAFALEVDDEGEYITLNGVLFSKG
ncbi:MAG: hypothetical protein K5675_07830 [Lachnospiraceae bacterium]|nr:hypothetical protein [Lachnospiraceae bacterium]